MSTTIKHWNNLPKDAQLALHEALNTLAEDEPKIAGLIEKLADAYEANPAAFKRITGYDALTAWNSLTEEDQLQIHKDLDRLAANNPGIVQQLRALADLKEKNPLQWQLGLKILKVKP